MKFGDFKRFFRQIDAGDGGATPGQTFGQNAAAAAYIQNGLAIQAGQTVNVVQTQRVDFVQGFEFAIGVSPFVGKCAEFVEFQLVGVAHNCSLSVRNS